MTDDEILDRFRRADALLAEYRQVIQPAADELARQKSLAVFGRAGGYGGEIGCYETGCDFVCAHLADAAREWPGSPYHERLGGTGAATAKRFDRCWQQRIVAAGVARVTVGGHF